MDTWMAFSIRNTGLTRITNGCLEQYNGFRKRKTIKNRIPHRYLLDNYSTVDGDGRKYLDLVVHKQKKDKRKGDSDDEIGC